MMTMMINLLNQVMENIVSECMKEKKPKEIRTFKQEDRDLSSRFTLVIGHRSI